MGLCCCSRKSSSSVQYDTKTSSKIFSTTFFSSSQAEGKILKSPNLKSFSLIELQQATGNFCWDKVLGRGGFGHVLEGFIDEDLLKADSSKTGTRIAVKMLEANGSQGQQEWLAEIKYLGQLYHPNIVKLMGYCIEAHHRLLVYEFMPNGSLEEHLFRSASHIHRWSQKMCGGDVKLKERGGRHVGWRYPLQPLSWDVRMKVALGVAKGLCFLHNVAKVIHRDLKSSDILLDSNFNAKISDFGLAKDLPDDKTHCSTRVLGTEVYADPEYRTTGHLTTKSDVYSFGVVLLELIFGWPAKTQYWPGPATHGYRLDMKENLVEWAMPLLSDKKRIFEVIDTHLEGENALSGAQNVAKLAVQCLSLRRNARPNMKKLVKALEQIASEGKLL